MAAARCNEVSRWSRNSACVVCASHLSPHHHCDHLTHSALCPRGLGGVAGTVPDVGGAAQAIVGISPT